MPHVNGIRTPKKLDSIEEFERGLAMEISLAEQYDLPLSVLTVAVDGEWVPGDTRRVLDSVRLADFITRSEPDEISIALPNTLLDEALIVEERLHRAVPEASIGLAEHERGDRIEDLLDRARHTSA